MSIFGNKKPVITKFRKTVLELESEKIETMPEKDVVLFAEEAEQEINKYLKRSKNNDTMG